MNVGIKSKYITLYDLVHELRMEGLIAITPGYIEVDNKTFNEFAKDNKTSLLTHWKKDTLELSCAIEGIDIVTSIGKK